jgi:hypothetical protein
MTVEDIIYKNFKDEKTIWFDFVDYIKSNYEQQRKGLSYTKNKGRYEIYAVNEDGDSFLLDVLDNSQGYKLERFVLAFSS